LNKILHKIVLRLLSLYKGHAEIIKIFKAHISRHNHNLSCKVEQFIQKAKKAASEEKIQGEEEKKATATKEDLPFISAFEKDFNELKTNKSSQDSMIEVEKILKLARKHFKHQDWLRRLLKDILQMMTGYAALRMIYRAFSNIPNEHLLFSYHKTTLQKELEQNLAQDSSAPVVIPL
jgi:hypothetical protein